MKDAQDLEVTATIAEELAAINETTEILFRKRRGLDAYLPGAADTYTDCPLLQIHTAIMYFFSFSAHLIEEKLPIYLGRVNPNVLNDREQTHYHALQRLQCFDFHGAIEYYKKLLRDYPQDKIAILMLQTSSFMSGCMQEMTESYMHIYPYFAHDPDFLGMLAFLYVHIDRHHEARKLIQTALKLSPHNAWVQHVYVHTLNEDNHAHIEKAILFLEGCSGNWPKQNRFFQGHNWMHLCGLYLKVKKDISFLLDAYSKHIWGEAKEFKFEQNNAFLTLWNMQLSGYSEAISDDLWTDLAKYAEPFMDDYFTPYMTVTAILSVAKMDMKKAEAALIRFERFASSHSTESLKHNAWHTIALPVLKGCMAYLKGNNEEAIILLEPVHNNTRPMGHSDEQRIIFTKIFCDASLKYRLT